MKKAELQGPGARDPSMQTGKGLDQPLGSGETVSAEVFKL